VRSKSTATDLVSEADERAEEAVVEFIRARRPDDGVVAEESAARESATGLRWLIDPLDGTINYLYGIPHWCVSVACADADGALAGAVFDPSRDELFTAARGAGAESEPPGFRRAGRLGDGLFLSRLPPEQIPGAWDETQAAARAAGRDPAALTLTSFARLQWTDEGQAQHAAETLRGLRQAGVQQIVLQFAAGTNPHPLDTASHSMTDARTSLERFLSVVRPAAGL